jgi:hypothetical protein
LQHINELQPAASYDYLAFPDILTSYQESIDTWSCEIYMVLLMNLVESMLPDADLLYDYMCAAVIRIMQVVRLFEDDHFSFWMFLQAVGCVTDTADEKNRQELAYPPAHGDTTSFRVHDRVCPYGINKFPQKLLDDFRSIRLVCPVSVFDQDARVDAQNPRVKYTTCETVLDITFDENANRKIDKFLQRYKAMSNPPETPASSDGTCVQTPCTPETYSPVYTPTEACLGQVSLLLESGPGDTEKRRAKNELAGSAKYRRRIQGAEEENGGSKANHCAPYNKDYTPQEQAGNAQCMSGDFHGAGNYYELLGRCQCDGGEGRCPGKRMLVCKCMPWTRFPTEKGMFCAIFKVWENPKPLRDPNQT